MSRLLALAAVVTLSTALLAVAFAAAAHAAASPDPAADPAPLVVFCVRHAEKDAGDDPGLTPQGSKRAEALAVLLRDAKITHVHSTDFRRTKLTAAPTSEKLGIETEIYDARDLRRLIDGLKKTGGRHLVVGHSNTTPSVVKMLGGDPGPPITESEYDRLYVVTVNGKRVTTVVLRL